MAYNQFGLNNLLCSFHHETHLSDYLFSLHAALFTLFQFWQYFYYPKGDNKISKFWAVITCLSLSTIVIAGILWHHNLEVFFIYIGILKVALTAFKYLPQVQLNIKRKSTHGLSVISIWMDLTGGVLSLLQIVIDWYIYETVGFFDELNYAKFLLSNVCIFYALIFLAQHYVIYNNYEVQRNNELSIEDVNKQNNFVTFLSDKGFFFVWLTIRGWRFGCV